jgi:hypothetical protein
MDKKKIMYISIILFSIIILISVIKIIINLNSGHKILYDEYDYFYGDKAVYIGTENMPDSEEGIKYSFSIWIRTDNVSGNSHWDTNVNIPKVILYNYGSPNILYLRKENIIQIQLSYRNSENSIEFYNFNLENFESQKWVNLIISVNNRTVNIYKNGVLYTSKLLPNVNLKNYKTLTIGEKYNNFNGYIGFLEYFNYDLDIIKANKIYNKRKYKYPTKLLSYEEYEYLKNTKNFFS